MATPKYKEKKAASEALRKNISKLTEAISGSAFQDIVLACEQKELIQLSFKRNLLDTSSTRTIDMKANELVSQMQTIISFMPSCLDTFLCIMRQCGGIPGRTVAEAIAKDYGYTLPNYEMSLRTSTVTSNESDKKLEERLAKLKKPISSLTSDLEQPHERSDSQDRKITYMSESTNSCVTVTRGEKIGRGSFKDVYVALNTEGNAEAAWCELVINPDNEKKVSIELKVLKDLRHPNILQLCHYQIFDNSEGKVMVLLTEFMFKDLKCYIKDNQPHISKWGCQILMGLQYLHEQSPPVIHRDLKCANLFIDESGDLVKIGDFGLSTLEEKEGRTIIGTFAYRAPEVFTRSYNESIDIYSFGLCLLEMYTRETPYRECHDNEEIRDKIIKHELPLALTKVQDVDKELKKIINNCLKFDPSERPTARELLELEYFKAI